MAAPHDDVMADETRGAFDAGFALVEGAHTPPEEDFLLLDTPGTGTAGDRDEAEHKEQITNLLLASAYSEVPDELCTQAALDRQLESLTTTISTLGLDKQAVPHSSVAHGNVGVGKPASPAGFVPASVPPSDATVKTLEKETLNLVLKDQVFTIEGWETVLPPLPESHLKYARTLTHGELSSLISTFRSTPLTPELVCRILEVYVIAVRSKQFNDMLKAPHTYQKGGSMEKIRTNDPGEENPLRCAGCNFPWLGNVKCLNCGTAEHIDVRQAPLSVIEVDGQAWHLRVTASGPTWFLPADTSGSKAAAGIEVGDLGTAPPKASAHGDGPTWVSFSEQVPASARVSLREHLTKFGSDEIFDLKPAAEKPPSADMEDTSQTALVFHPKAIEIVKFKANLLATDLQESSVETKEAKRRRLEEKDKAAAEALDDEMEIMVNLQQGAHSVEEPEGAQLLRCVDLQAFRDYIQKRHAETGHVVDMDAIIATQTTQAKATAANKQLDQDFRERKKLLTPATVDGFNVWPDDLRKAWQSNAFEPGHMPEGPEQFDFQKLKLTYLTMKEFLKGNQCPIPGRVLLQEMPAVGLDAYEYVDQEDTSYIGRLARALPDHSPERKFAIMDHILNIHVGEVRAWGGFWERRPGPLEAPAWAKPAAIDEVLALEQRTNPIGMDDCEPNFYTDGEVLKQIADGKRPTMAKVLGFFWAPSDAVAHGADSSACHYVRRVTSWDLPTLITMLGQRFTFKQLYQVWREMPLLIKPGRRGHGDGIAKKKAEQLAAMKQKTKDIKNFLESIGLRHPKNHSEVKFLYKELGSFMAASTFLARTPPEVMRLAPADIQDSKQQMMFRAVCDERITLPVSAFKDFDDIHRDLMSRLGPKNVVDVQVSWRCNHVLWWVALVTPAEAAKCYHKLGFSTAETDKFLRDAEENGAGGAPPVAQGSEACPQLSVANVASLCSPKYRREHFGNKFAHAFRGKADCGLILSSISPWELKVKESGVTRGGWVCKSCQGFWKQSLGATRFVQITGKHRGERVCLQLILDEPPQGLYNEWVKSRLEYYKRVEPTAPPRDVALEVDSDHTHRLKFSCQEGKGNISNMIWGVLLSNPEAAGLRKIEEVAAAHAAQ